MQISPIKTRIFKEGEDLFQFILEYVKNIPEKSVLVVTSKIVSLAEERVVLYKNQNQKINLIKQESEFAVKTKLAWLTIKNGIFMPFSGIDESNADGKLILSPRDSFKTAEVLRKKLIQKFKLKNFGVLITDSQLIPLRGGVIGLALGYAGFQGIKNNVGKKDIFNRVLKMSKTDIADGLATSAIICMGEAKEQQPLAIITGAPIVFANKINRNELIIDPQKDIYAPLFIGFKKRNGK